MKVRERKRLGDEDDSWRKVAILGAFEKIFIFH
jgi:hypothetical protein